MVRAPLRAQTQESRLQRARSLVLYLEGGRLVAEEFLGDRRFEVNEAALKLLRLFDRWKTPAEAVAELPRYSALSVRRSIDLLLRRGLLMREGSAAAGQQEALRRWASWDRSGTYFHFSTRHAHFARSDRELRRIVSRVTREPMPPIYKDVPGRRLPLPNPHPDLAPGPLGRALLRRRTCREFLRRPIPRGDLDAITSLTFGRLGMLDGGPYGRLLHRASPSGGARHTIECYVMALNVAGLRRGLYHYSVRDNAFVRVRDEASRVQVTRFTFGQDYFSDAAAVFILTAVFSRSQWKYHDPRAYRVLLFDAAHACQNLLLVATSLGLGAFCLAALDEKAMDRYVGADGISEGTLYMAGVGLPDRRRIRRATGSLGYLLPATEARS